MSTIGIIEHKVKIYADQQVPQPKKPNKAYAAAVKKAAKEQGINIGLSQGEEMLARDLDILKIAYQREFFFCKGRKWRSDFHILNTNIMIEIEGGGEEGRHMRHDGFIEDCLKYNRAAIMGYRILRYTFAMIKNGIARQDIEELMGITV